MTALHLKRRHFLWATLAIISSARVAKARGMSDEILARVVTQSTEERQFGFLGTPRVNVLALNLALDKLPK